MTSEIEVEILKCQGINNIPALLRARDLYSIFKIDSEELEDLRNRACLKLKDGEYMIRPAIKDNLAYCINEFKNKLNEKHSQPEHPDQNSNTQDDSFMITFIKSLTDNMNRSKHCYQYNINMRRFTSCVYLLGGRNVYQFLKLNLPGAFPAIQTLDSYNEEYCKRIQEGEFRFEDLENYSNKINSFFVYASEDCTRVVSKVYYDAVSNSFVGFCSTFNNGLPTVRQYQTNDFFQLEEWFESIERSTLMNIFTIQHITNKGVPPFLLSSFGTNNKLDSISVFHR
ncbi:unnamed protein product [Rotaria sp. Silwood2]|nr:unnamed protein product [Rotaria sp. Silwood2]CAF3255948.1 unnamed protein product [Rotaria sp. Silwood2]CAF3547877.1 unnamed protein product [Rotaria sp. Silwood2]CAF4627874.1 unnamed protein product [Rotaria sp. Silwood2]CAF4649688.1 unnamed protein product [Rotaria sp. Silwood2]